MLEHIPQRHAGVLCSADGTHVPHDSLGLHEAAEMRAAVAGALHRRHDSSLGELGLQIVEGELHRLHARPGDCEAVVLGVDVRDRVVVPHEEEVRGGDGRVDEQLAGRLGAARLGPVQDERRMAGRVDREGVVGGRGVRGGEVVGVQRADAHVAQRVEGEGRVVVLLVKIPKGIYGFPRSKHDFVHPTRVPFHELCNVINALFVCHPNSDLGLVMRSNVCLSINW
mmetsp:Transcript_77112/g.208214  ORF Transcript_77112/g.208214 Transcript_77112/m.208214 type:complete len:225 (-) Transcript_77112:322-996(-)